MAFAVGDRARVRLSSAALSDSKVQPQPPRIGVVTRVVGGPPDVIDLVFEDGKVLNIAATFLDEVRDAQAATITAFQGRVAVGTRASAQFSQALRGNVIDLYGIDPGGAGAFTDFVLIKPKTGPWYEVAATAAVVIGDR